MSYKSITSWILAMIVGAIVAMILANNQQVVEGMKRTAEDDAVDSSSKKQATSSQHPHETTQQQQQHQQEEEAPRPPQPMSLLAQVQQGIQHGNPITFDQPPPTRIGAPHQATHPNAVAARQQAMIPPPVSRNNVASPARPRQLSEVPQQAPSGSQQDTAAPQPLVRVKQRPVGLRQHSAIPQQVPAAPQQRHDDGPMISDGPKPDINQLMAQYVMTKMLAPKHQGDTMESTSSKLLPRVPPWNPFPDALVAPKQEHGLNTIGPPDQASAQHDGTRMNAPQQALHSNKSASAHQHATNIPPTSRNSIARPTGQRPGPIRPQQALARSQQQHHPIRSQQYPAGSQQRTAVPQPLVRAKQRPVGLQQHPAVAQQIPAAPPQRYDDGPTVSADPKPDINQLLAQYVSRMFGPQASQRQQQQPQSAAGPSEISPSLLMPSSPVAQPRAREQTMPPISDDSSSSDSSTGSSKATTSTTLTIIGPEDKTIVFKSDKDLDKMTSEIRILNHGTEKQQFHVFNSKRTAAMFSMKPADGKGTLEAGQEATVKLTLLSDTFVIAAGTKFTMQGGEVGKPQTEWEFTARFDKT